MSQIIDAAIATAIKVIGIGTYDWSQVPGDYIEKFDNKWPDSLLERNLAAIEAMKTLQLTQEELATIDAGTAFQAVKNIYVQFSDAAGLALKAIDDGDLTAAIIAVPKHQARLAIAAIYYYNSNGANLHYEGVFERAIQSGTITMEQAETHMSRCWSIFDAIAKCGKLGLFNPLGAAGAASTNGLGFDPFTDLTIGQLIVVALLIVAMLFIIVWAYNQSKLQALVLNQCEKLIEEGQYDAAAKCREGAQNAANDPMNHFLDGLLKPIQIVGYTAAGALALYVAAKYIWPAVTEQKARSAPALGA